MSEGSVTSARRPIISLEDYRDRNAKKAKAYYYRNQDVLKNKMKQRAKSKNEQTQENIKTALEAVGDISLALVKIQDVLKTLVKSQRASNEDQ